MVRQRLMFHLCWTVLTFPHQTLADAFSLQTLLYNHDVLIVGEAHRRPESTTLFANTVSDFLHTGRCLNVGLEVDSDQQATLDAVLRGEASVSDIRIHPIIDHQGFRDLIGSLSRHTRSGKCLTVRFIDAPQDASADRDTWMTEQIMGMIGDRPVIVLSGNLHGLKTVEWHATVTRPKRYLGETLKLAGIRVATVLQDWHPSDCTRYKPTMLSTEDPKSLPVLTRIMDPLAATTPSNAATVMDGVIVWRCASWSRDSPSSP